jgi:hypothetical protein
MRQLLVRGGGVAIEEVPAPVAARQIHGRVAYSSVSVGAELTSVRMSGLPLYRRTLKQGLLRGKGRTAPDDRIQPAVQSGDAGPPIGDRRTTEPTYRE